MFNRSAFAKHAGISISARLPRLTHFAATQLLRTLDRLGSTRFPNDFIWHHPSSFTFLSKDRKNSLCALFSVPRIKTLVQDLNPVEKRGPHHLCPLLFLPLLLFFALLSFFSLSHLLIPRFHYDAIIASRERERERERERGREREREDRYPNLSIQPTTSMKRKNNMQGNFLHFRISLHFSFLEGKLHDLGLFVWPQLEMHLQ